MKAPCTINEDPETNSMKCSPPDAVFFSKRKATAKQTQWNPALQSPR